MRTLLNILLWVVATCCLLLAALPTMLLWACFDGLERKPLGHHMRTILPDAIKRAVGEVESKTDRS